MALTVSGLKSQLANIRSRWYKTPDECAQDWCQAIVNFWLSGQGPPNASTVITTPASLALMVSPIAGAWRQFSPMADTPAQQVSTAVVNGLTAIIPVGPQYGANISVVVPSAGSFTSALARIWKSRYPSGAQCGMEEGDALFQLTISALCSGSGAPPTYPPIVNGAIS